MGIDVIIEGFLSFPWAVCIPHVTHLAFRKKCHAVGEKRGEGDGGEKVICGRARTWREITMLSFTILEYEKHFVETLSQNNKA